MPRRLFSLLPVVLTGSAWAADPATAPASGTPLASPLSGSQFVETLLGLAAVLLLIFALAFVVRRFGNLPGMGKGRIQVLGGLSLGSREKAVLVEVEGQRLLLGVAPGRVQTLHVLPAREDSSFGAALDDAVSDTGGAD